MSRRSDRAATSDEDRALLLRSASEIATIEDLRTVIAGISAAHAAEVFAKAQHSPEWQNRAADYRLRYERRAGQLLIDMAARGERAMPETARSTNTTLGDLGVTAMQSSRWQEVADIRDATFENYIASAHREGEITRAGLLAFRAGMTQISSRSYEWWTPPEYIDAARRVMGGIDVDPASCAEANLTVQAAVYYDQYSNGLLYDWPGRVFLNPPYGEWTRPFVERLVEQYESGITEQAILLINAFATCANWFDPLWQQLLCFTRGRIEFDNPNHAPSNNRHGSVLAYFGDRLAAFEDAFAAFGAVVGTRAAWEPSV